MFVFVHLRMFQNIYYFVFQCRVHRLLCTQEYNYLLLSIVFVTVRGSVLEYNLNKTLVLTTPQVHSN